MVCFLATLFFWGGPHPQHMQVPGPEIESELQINLLRCSAMAMATPDP